jgi:probable HAF family extracellular repeat protein
MSFVSGTRTGAWIGFTDEITEGEWRWLDGTPGIWQDPRNFPSPIQTTYTNWIPGEPNDFATGEDYGLFSCEAGYYPGQWNDGDGPSRGTPFSYIVEFVAVPEPSTCISLVAGIAIGSWNAFRRRKHRRALTGLGLALLTALHPAVGSAQNLIRNGSFEAPFASAGIISITPSSVPAGFVWSVDAGSVEVTRQNYIGGTLGNLPFLGAAADGSQWLDLDGEEVRGGPGTISQAFVTGSGAEYSLTFSYSSNPYRAYPGPAHATVSVIDAVSLAALVAPFQIAHSSSTASDFDWRHSPAATFVATSGSALLRFTSNDPLNSDAGVLLDAISVTAVPEPALCFAMALVAACSLMMLRGRRSTRPTTDRRWPLALVHVTLTLSVAVASHASSVNANHILAVRWTSTDGMQPMGALPGDTQGSAEGISTDGKVIVGWSGSETAVFREAYRWSETTGIIGLGFLPGHDRSVAYGASADGSVVVGWSSRNAFPPPSLQAFRWTATAGMSGLGTLPGDAVSQAYRTSDDGKVVVGRSAGGSRERAFRWTLEDGMQDLGALDVYGSNASDLSADGTVVVGGSYRSGSSEAFRWTLNGGMEGLGTLPGFHSSWASGVSADGSVVVGTLRGDGAQQAFRWTQTTGMVGLGYLPAGSSSSGNDVSADGSVVVGWSSGSYEGQGFTWSMNSGMSGIGFLPNAGYSWANGVSGDGTVVVGQASPAIIPEPSAFIATSTGLTFAGFIALRRRRLLSRSRAASRQLS